MKKYLVLLASLLIGKAHAQETADTRYIRTAQATLQAVPGNGQEAIAQLSAGDSVQVLLPQPGAMPHVLASTTKQYIFVRHAAEQGWVMRTALVGSRDSVAARELVTTASLSSDGTGRYVPVTEASAPYSAGGKVVRVVGTGARKPNYTKARVSSSSRSYYTGPRGGCYYINANGNKEYVDHSFCQ